MGTKPKPGATAPKRKGVYFHTRNLDPEVARRFRVYAAERGITKERAMNDLLRMALDLSDAPGKRKRAA